VAAQHSRGAQDSKPHIRDKATSGLYEQRCVGVIISMGEKYGFVRGEEAYELFGKDVFLDIQENIGAAGFKRGTMVQFTCREVHGKGPQAYATAAYRLSDSVLGKDMEKSRLEAFIRVHLSSPTDWMVEEELRRLSPRLQAEVFNQYAQKWRRGTVGDMLRRVVAEDRELQSQRDAGKREAEDHARKQSRSISRRRRGRSTSRRRMNTNLRDIPLVRPRDRLNSRSRSPIKRNIRPVTNETEPRRGRFSRSLARRCEPIERKSFCSRRPSAHCGRECFAANPAHTTQPIRQQKRQP